MPLRLKDKLSKGKIELAVAGVVRGERSVEVNLRVGAIVR